LDEETLRVMKESQKINTKLIPCYVSPYNKQMLGSGLPLKSIIKKTNAFMKKKRAKKRQKVSKSPKKFGT